uniref:G-protein coupled receptors family 3 profile domain-containing protein n=2 Tax=Dendroctonus ponderosae TaxID=77166 RepID=A0AAR5P745_DENPD
ISRPGNLADVAPGEIFDVFKLLNSSLGLENDTDGTSSELNNAKHVHILGLFELTTKLGGRSGVSELMAANLAVQHVNALNILPGYKLILLINDTQCDPGVAVDRLFHAIYSKMTVFMLLGSGCSNVSEALAQVVPYWNIIQVSYGSKSPALSDRRKFPLFFRTAAPDSTHNIAKARFIKYHKWQMVAAFSQSENRYLLPINHLITELEKENVTCISTVTFSSDNYKDQLQLLKNIEDKSAIPVGRMSKYAKQSYDAIWAMSLSLAASNIGSFEQFSYSNRQVGRSFFETMRKLKFVGLSVHRKIRWQNDRVPIAKRIFKTTQVTIPKVLFSLTTGISVFGIICSLVFLYFNAKFRQMKTIKLSSPNLNNLTVTGCILVYVSVILFGLHSVNWFSDLCSARIFLLSAGCSLTFGSIFAKSYRVHRLFTYTSAGLVKNKLLKDQQLIGLILIPIAIDFFIVALWSSVDPLRKQPHDLKLQISAEDRRIVYQPQIQICQCRNTIGWHVALFGYKSILLVMGVCMAWKTRHVEIAALNDSQFIGICVYSAIFSTIIVIAFSFVTEYFVLSYVAKSASILASTSITLVLMLLPRLKSVFAQTDAELSLMESLGLKIQSNTRRFIYDDPKELLSRLEIQNKVYQSRLEFLDREIVRLEEILEHSHPSSNCSSINAIQVIPEIHVLKVPRASWPTWHNQPIKTFSSENRLNNERSGDRTTKFYGKIKKFFGGSGKTSGEKLQLGSNPEISHLAPCRETVGNINSKSSIRSSY